VFFLCAVNIGNEHWVLLNINLRCRTFEIYDSCDAYADAHAHIFLQARAFMGMLWAMEQLGDGVQVREGTGFPLPTSTLILDDWVEINWRRSPAGDNFPTQPGRSNDCALYTLFYFAALRFGVRFFGYANSEAMRVDLAALLLFKGRITHETEPTVTL